MPGMMDTILNLGLNDSTVEGLALKTGNARFAWDAYRRFISMYGCIVLHMKPHGKEEVHPFESVLERIKEEKNYKLDTDLTVDDLKNLVREFKIAVFSHTGKDFP
jgi:pyruvate,orthophosphate dikinase